MTMKKGVRLSPLDSVIKQLFPKSRLPGKQARMHKLLKNFNSIR